MLYKLKTQLIYFKYLPHYFKFTSNTNNNNLYKADKGQDLMKLFKKNTTPSLSTDYKSIISSQ